MTDSQLELSYYMFQTFVSLSAGMIHASGCPSVRWLGLFFLLFLLVCLFLCVKCLFMDVHIAINSQLPYLNLRKHAAVNLGPELNEYSE